MAKAASIFRTISNLSYPLEKVVFTVNNELVEAKFKGMFMTAVFGKFNTETGEAIFVNAGHESIMVFDKEKNFEFMKSQIPPIGILKYSTESMVKSIATNLKEKTFLIYTDGVTEGYLSNGQELGVEGVERIIKKIENVTPQNIINSITTELNWGAEKLRDDITCLALNIRNTELAKQKWIIRQIQREYVRMIERMKKNIFYIIVFIVLNGCTQYSSAVGPIYTLAKTGNPILAGASAATSYGIKKTTGSTPAEHVNTLVKNNSSLMDGEKQKKCQIIHSSSLNQIFFETLDEIDCFQDSFSKLK